MKTVERHKKTDFGDVWYVNAVDGTYRFAVYKYDDDDETIYLSNVFVKEDSRRQGYGNEILTSAEDYAKRLNASVICLKVLSGSDVHRWYKRHGYEDLEKDEEERGYMWMRKVLNVTESVWTDMQDRGTGDLEKKEDEIPEQFKKVLAIYIHTFAHLEAAAGNYTVGSCSEFIAFIKDYQNKPAIAREDPDIPELVQYVRDNWDFVCDIIMKTITKVDNEVSVVVDNIIDDMKKGVNESIWSDMQDRGTGESVKTEDIDNMSIAELYEYMQKIYACTRKYDIYYNNGSDTMTATLFNDKVKGYNIFFMKSNTNSRKIVYVEKDLVDALGCFDEMKDKYYVKTYDDVSDGVGVDIYPDVYTEPTNRFFLEVFDYLLDKIHSPLEKHIEKKSDVNESIWSDMQERGTGDSVKIEDITEEDKKDIDYIFNGFAYLIVYADYEPTIDDFIKMVKEAYPDKDNSKYITWVRLNWDKKYKDELDKKIQDNKKDVDKRINIYLNNFVGQIVYCEKYNVSLPDIKKFSDEICGIPQEMRFVGKIRVDESWLDIFKKYVDENWNDVKKRINDFIVEENKKIAKTGFKKTPGKKICDILDEWWDSLGDEKYDIAWDEFGERAEEKYYEEHNPKYNEYTGEDFDADEEWSNASWIESVEIYMKYNQKTNESIWSDMQDRGTGDSVKKEDDVNLMDMDRFADYLRKIYDAKNNLLINSGNKYIILPVLSYRCTYRSILLYPEKKRAQVRKSNYEKWPEGIRDYLDDNYDVEMSLDEKKDWMYFIFPKNGKEANNRFFISLIDDILAHVDEPLLERKVNESIWSDMQDRGTGDLVKKEDDVNMMDVNKFFEYLIAKYWRPEQKVNSLDKDHYSKDFETDIVVDPKHGITIFGSYNDGELRRLMVVSNKLFLHIGAKSPKNLVWTPSKPGESLNRRYYITEKNREISNKTFIDVIEFFLHNEINESIWSDMQERGVKNVEKKEDKMSQQDLECLDQYIMNFANEVVYGQGRGEEAGNLDEFCDYIRKDNEVKDANKDRILKYVKEVWFDELCDEVSGAIEQTQKEYHQDLYESVWSDMQDRGTGEIEKVEDNINNLDFDGFYDYLMSRYEFSDSNFGIEKFTDDNLINLSLLEDIEALRVYRTNIFDWDKDPYITVPDIKSFTKRPLFKKLSDNFKLEHIDDSFSPKFKVLPKDGGDADKKHFIKVIDFIIDNAKSPLVPTIKRRVNESVWSDMQERGTGDLVKKEDDMTSDDFIMLKETAKMFRNALKSHAPYKDTCDNFIEYITYRKNEHFWSDTPDKVYDKVIKFVMDNWTDNSMGIQEFIDKYLNNINECDGVPGGLTPADVGGMGAAYFPGPEGIPGSGDLPMPTGHVYKQIAPFDTFLKERKKKKNKKKKFRKEDEPCVHSPNAKVYDYVDDYREYVDRTYNNVDKRK